MESSKSAVLVEAAKVQKMAIAEEAKEKLLLRATGDLSFFNTSPMDLSTLGESGMKVNLERYIQCFSKDAREIFDHIKFTEFMGLLNDATIRDKVGENRKVMKQIENNSAEQALLGSLSKAIGDATLDSSEAHQNQMMQLLADPSKAANFARIVFDLLVQGQGGNPLNQLRP